VFLVLCGDFGWSQRRNASSGVYVLIDASTGKVLHQIVLKKASSSLSVTRIARSSTSCAPIHEQKVESRWSTTCC